MNIRIKITSGKNNFNLPQMHVCYNNKTFELQYEYPN